MTPMHPDFIRHELTKTASVIEAMLVDAHLLATIEAVGRAGATAIQSGGKVMFCGNGGSAADSQHLAAELVGKLVLDRNAMAGLALTVDSSALTAIGNDFGYEHVFGRQVQGLGRAGDVLIGLSTSGRSKNVVNAMKVARENSILTVAMTGPDRGPIAELADHWIAVPHPDTQKIQEGHIMIGHIFCALIEQHVHGRSGPK
jgi:D-sedoheptulose 7-phosphate isomerase